MATVLVIFPLIKIDIFHLGPQKEAESAPLSEGERRWMCNDSISVKPFFVERPLRENTVISAEYDTQDISKRVSHY